MAEILVGGPACCQCRRRRWGRPPGGGRTSGAASMSKRSDVCVPVIGNSNRSASSSRRLNPKRSRTPRAHRRPRRSRSSRRRLCRPPGTGEGPQPRNGDGAAGHRAGLQPRHQSPYHSVEDTVNRYSGVACSSRFRIHVLQVLRWTIVVPAGGRTLSESIYVEDDVKNHQF